jgi:hypothetical protein
LRQSRLVFAERSFSIKRPINLAARVDRVYDDGSALVLLELKTRLGTQIFASDIIELSAQRLTIQLGTNYRVHEYGFILLLNPVTHRKTIHKVSLYAEDEVIAIARRRRLILADVIEPSGPPDVACCRCCEYRTECISEPGITTKPSKHDPDSVRNR